MGDNTQLAPQRITPYTIVAFSALVGTALLLRKKKTRSYGIAAAAGLFWVYNQLKHIS